MSVACAPLCIRLAHYMSSLAAEDNWFILIRGTWQRLALFVGVRETDGAGDLSEALRPQDHLHQTLQF